MLSRLFKMAGPGFIALWCAGLAGGITIIGLVIYILIHLAAYVAHLH